MNVAEHLGVRPPLNAPKSSNALFVNSRNLGFEAERESCGSIWKLPILNYLIIKEDGSLRDSGMEFVFRSPLYGSDIISAFKELHTVHKTVQPTHSYRTSDHFHVDICDFVEDELDNLFHNSLLLENTLFNFGTLVQKWDRKTNSYCTPVGKYLSNNLTPKGWNILDIPKYLGFRFSQQFGTIEYRMFNSTDSSIIEINRANVLMELVENSKRIILNKDLSNLNSLLPNAHKILRPYLTKPVDIELETDINYNNYIASIRNY